MALTDSVGLLFKLKAENETEKAFAEVTKEIKNTTDVAQKGTAGFQQFASGIGLSESATSKFSAALPIAGAALGGLAAIAATATTAIIGAGTALFNLAEKASEYGSQIADVQAKTGLAAETLSSLRYAAQLSGSSFEAVSGSTTKFAKLLGEAAKGSETAQAKLKALGVTSKDLDEALQQAFVTINSLPEGVEQMTAATDAFGKSGADLIPLIKTMDGDLTDFTEKAKVLGVTLTESDVKAADEFGDTLDTLKTQVKNISSVFALQFAPVITDAMKQISKAFAENQDAARKWGGNLADLMRGISIAAKSETASSIASWAAWAVKMQTILDPVSGQLLKLIQRSIELLKLQGRSAQKASAGMGDVEAGTTSGGISKDYTGGFTGGGGGGKSAVDKLKDFKMSDKAKALVKAAEKLGVSPLDLATLISYETGGTFSTDIMGGKGGNYQGLIQFGKEERAKFGVRKGQSFEDQLLNSVVPYLKKRFENVGRSTQGATLLDLYKAVNGGNPNVSSNASDGKDRFGNRQTIGGHVERMMREHMPKVLGQFFGGASKNVPTVTPSREQALSEEKKILDEKQKLRDADLKSWKDHVDRIIEIDDALEKERERGFKEEEDRQKLLLDQSNERVELLVKEVEIEREREEWRQKSVLNAGGIGAPKTKIEPGQPDTPGIWDTITGGIGGLIGGDLDPEGKITEQAEYMKAVYNDLAGVAQNAIGSMVSGLAGLAQQWILTGKFSAKAALAMAAGVIAGLAIESGIKAIFELAQGFAAAAVGNAPGAALHFAAAKTYGLVAAGAGAVAVGLAVAGRAAGGSEGAAGAFAGTSRGGSTVGGNSFGGTNNRLIEEDRNRFGRQEVHILQFPRGLIEREVIDGINNRTALHGAIVRLAEES